MHLSIPDCEEVTEGGGSSRKYVQYNIHINGTYHCSARYSQLEKLHEQLKKAFGPGCLEQFPTKSVFYVKPDDALERRVLLQRWLQRIGAQQLLVDSEPFQTFLLNAQREVQRGPEEDVALDVFLINGKSVRVEIVSTNQTDDVLETACALLELRPALTYYFALFLVGDESGRVVIRRLQDFESPYISLKRADPANKIMLRVAYTDPRLDAELAACPVAMNLLYIETLAAMKHGAVVVAPADADRLAALRAAKDREGFLALARQQRGYGAHYFPSVRTNVPAPDSVVDLRLAASGITLTDGAGKDHEFLIQRIRCWRTFTAEAGGVEMEIEYFFENASKPGAGDMGWVKFVTPQVIHLAMCLQYTVEEIMRLRQRRPLRQPADRAGKFKPRRQSEKPTDLSFLVSDAGTDAGPKFSVLLSDLRSKVRTANAAIASSKPPKPPKEDPDDYDSDEDDGRAYSHMAGF